MMTRTARLVAFLTLLIAAACTPVAERPRVPVPMRCDAIVRDPIDCKLIEFWCRQHDGRWTGTECVR